MVTIEEKMKLAEEVGAKTYLKTLQIQQKVSSIVNLRFKPITTDEIKKKICRRWYFDKTLYIFDMPHSMIFVISLSIVTLGLVNLFFFRKPILEHVKIESWEGQLPYGALLAMKEAKKMGIGVFRIYFPVTHNGHRIRTDPVIVGKVMKFLKYGSVGNYFCPELEIFSWDDGKIYE